MVMRYNRTNTCERCGKDLIHGARREKDNNRNWTGRWICLDCHNRDYYYNVRKKDPNSQNNIIRSISDIRTGNLNTNSNTAKGRLLEEVTVRSRGVKNLNIENLHAKIDHSPDKEYGIIQTKSSTLHEYIYESSILKFWKFDAVGEQYKEFDYLFAYCLDKYMKMIERVYIIPKEELMKRSTIKIYKNHSKGWYEKYRVDETVYNDIYQKIIEDGIEKVLKI